VKQSSPGLLVSIRVVIEAQRALSLYSSRTLHAVPEMRYMGKDKVLFRQRFVQKILDGSVRVARIVGAYDLLGELR